MTYYVIESTLCPGIFLNQIIPDELWICGSDGACKLLSEAEAEQVREMLERPYRCVVKPYFEAEK